MSPKFLRVLCAFALTMALVPVGALSALADEGSELSGEAASGDVEQPAPATSGVDEEAPRFAEADPDEGLAPGEQTRVPDYYDVLSRADHPEQSYTLYYYTVNGTDCYRVYGSVDGRNVGYYAYDIYSGTVDASHKLDNAEEWATTAAEAARLAAEKAAAEAPATVVEATQPETDISAGTDLEAGSSQAEPFSDDVATLAGTNYTPDSPNFKVAITNLGMTPNAGIWPGDKCELAFNWNVAFSGVQNSFKNGDTVTIPTNLADLYQFAGGWTSNVATADGTVVATLTLNADGNIVIAFNQAAEDMGLVGLYGTFPGYFEKFSAKNLDLSADSNEALTVASETVSLGFKGGKQLNVVSVGNGSASLAGGAVSAMLNSGSAEITGTPNASETLKSVTLTKADGTKQTIVADASGKVVIDASDLQNGKNTVTYEFSTNTTPPSTDVLSEWTWDNKAYWGSDAPTGSTLLTSAHFNVQFNYQSMLGLYQSGGTNLNHFKEDGTVSNTFFEDTVPGGSNVKAICGDRNGNGKPKIWATLYDVATATVDAYTNNPNPTTTPTTKVLKNVDLVANGTISEVVQGAGESLSSFRNRVQAAPLTYGIHKDPATGVMTLMVNLGSPGTPGSGVNATATWGDAVTSNATLNTIYGDGNVVGGNIQAFQIEYFADYAGTPYPLSGLTNAIEYTRTNAQGATATSSIVSSAYSVPGNTVVAVPSKGELRITKVDVLTHAPIQGAVFKVQIQGSDGSWSDYHESLGNVVQGTTGADGKVLLGAMASNSTYRAVEVSAPAPYASDSLAFTHIGGIAISSTGEFSMSNSDVEGCEALATNQKAFTVTYDANGGSGTMTDPNSPYAEGAAWSPLGNAFTYAHHHFLGWNTEANGTGQSYNVGQIYNISKDITLYAQWAVDAHSVSYVSSDTGKGVVAGGPEAVEHGSNPTMIGVTVTPSTGFEPASPAWSYSMAKDDGSFTSDTTNDPSSVAITGDTVFMALFKEKANVAIAYASSSTSMGTVTPQSESLAPVTGAAAGSTATANPGYHFVKWTNDVDSTETTDATLTGAQVDAVAKASGTYVPVTFTALFAEDPDVTVSYVSDDTSMGTVSPATEVLHPATSAAAGSTATALPGYHFVKWTNNVNAAETTDAVLSPAQVDAVAKATGIYVPVTFTAHFAEDLDVNLAYVSDDASMGSAAPSDEAVAPATGAATGATAVPEPGYHFVKWTNDVDSTETTDAVLSPAQVDAVAKATGIYVPVTFTAHFAEDPDVDLAYVSSDVSMGTVSPAGESLAPATGTASGSTATANPGYHFVKWTNDVDATETTDAVLSPTQVDAVAKASGIYVPVTFTAHFEKDPATIVEVVKSVDKDTAKPGDILTYTIHVANKGAYKSEGIFVKDIIPANTTFVECDGRGVYGTTGSSENYVKWWIGEGLLPGTSLDLTLKVRVNECQDGTEIANVALWQETTSKPDTPEAENQASGTNKVKTTVNGSRPPALTKMVRTGDGLLMGCATLVLVATVCGAGLLLARRRVDKDAVKNRR